MHAYSTMFWQLQLLNGVMVKKKRNHHRGNSIRDTRDPAAGVVMR